MALALKDFILSHELLLKNGVSEQFVLEFIDALENESFIINIEQTLKWNIFNRKDSAKAALIRSFIKDFDYKIDVDKPINKRKGQPKENIYINFECFGALAFNSKTDKGTLIWRHVDIMKKIKTEYLKKKVSGALEIIAPSPITALNKEIVYVLNFYPYDDGVYKIGRTTNLKSRLAQLGTSTPNNIIVEYWIEVEDAKLYEELIHHMLDKHRINPKREFFKLDIKKIKKCIYDTVNEVETIHQTISLKNIKNN